MLTVDRTLRLCQESVVREDLVTSDENNAVCAGLETAARGLCTELRWVGAGLNGERVS